MIRTSQRFILAHLTMLDNILYSTGLLGFEINGRQILLGLKSLRTGGAGGELSAAYSLRYLYKRKSLFSLAFTLD